MTFVYCTVVCRLKGELIPVATVWCSERYFLAHGAWSLWGFKARIRWQNVNDVVNQRKS